MTALTPMRETLHRLADDDAVDPMAFMLALALAAATRDLDDEAMWDAPPRLCVVLRIDEPLDTGLRVSELQTPGRGVDPLVLLEAAAEMMEETAAAELPPADVVGWLYVVEAWMLVGTDQEALEKVAGERLIRHDPDARECRVALLVDRAGRLYQTLTVRGSGDEPTMMVTGPGGNGVADGRVLGALQHLMDVTPVGDS